MDESLRSCQSERRGLKINDKAINLSACSEKGERFLPSTLIRREIRPAPVGADKNAVENTFPL